MYLINIITLQLKHFIDAGNCPPYAILSHRWTDDEITFKDFTKGRLKKSFGHKKIRDFCMAVREDPRYENHPKWAWADTCCIDKRSSADLQEAINSMFDYYRRAQGCYVYLADVDATTFAEEFEHQFLRSEWFTRGWTLQELVAPAMVIFYNKDWRRLGVILDGGLRSLVSRASGIEHRYLPGGQNSCFNVTNASVACRMSWASARRTTRGEDVAYCLLGLFRVNMPLLYGEGREKAFLRLQEEIMRNSDDHSLFAWTSRDDELVRELRSNAIGYTKTRGLLADDPSCFSGSQAVTPSVPRQWADTDPYELTSRGTKIVLSLLYWADDVYLARLDCQIDDSSEPIIILRKITRDKAVFQRIFCEIFALNPKRVPCDSPDWKLQAISVRQAVDGSAWRQEPHYFLRNMWQGAKYRLKVLPLDHSSGSRKDNQTGEEYRVTFHTGPLREQVGDFATLLVKNTDTNEELIISFASLSAFFVGFTVSISRDLGGTTFSTLKKLQPRPAAVPQAEWQNSLLDPTWISPLSHPKLHRLGSRVFLASLRDPEWYHYIRVDIDPVMGRMSHSKEYRLILAVDYRRRALCENSAANGYVVVPPSGYVVDEDEGT